VEAAQESAGYEPDDGDEEKAVTTSVIKSYLKTLIDDLKESEGESGKQVRAEYRATLAGIIAIEQRISAAKGAIKQEEAELEFKLTLKRIGADDAKAENQELLRQVEDEVAKLDPNNRADKSKINKLEKTK
jgi:type I restriction enzyme M protein